MPEVGGGRSYRDELAAAYERIRQLEARNKDLEVALRNHAEDASLEQVRDLDATLQRWDRVRASLAMLLGFTGLFALRIADTWSVRLALLSTCAAMVTVGIILAWPKMVRAQVDPKPHALDVVPWRKRVGKGRVGARAEEDRNQGVARTGVRVAAGGEGDRRTTPGVEVEVEAAAEARGQRGSVTPDRSE